MAYVPRMDISEAERIKIVTVSLSAVGRGWSGLAGAGFSNSFGLGKLEVFFLCLFLLFLS